MTEPEFWTALESRVSRAIAQLRDNRLRFLFCDGFIPDDHQPDDDVIIGRAFISEGDGPHLNYRFRLWLQPHVPLGPGRPDW
jgi:hypothetical protein